MSSKGYVVLHLYAAFFCLFMLEEFLNFCWYSSLHSCQKLMKSSSKSGPYILVAVFMKYCISFFSCGPSGSRGWRLLAAVASAPTYFFPFFRLDSP